MEDNYSKYQLKRGGGIFSTRYKFFGDGGILLFKSKGNIWTGTVEIKSAINQEKLYLKKVTALGMTYDLYRAYEKIATIKPKSWINVYNLELHTRKFENIELKSNTWASQFTIYNKEEEVGVISAKNWSSTELGIVLKNIQIEDVIIFALMITLNIMRTSNM